MSGSLNIGFGGLATVESASYEVVTLPPLEPEPLDPEEPLEPEDVNDETKITEINN